MPIEVQKARSIRLPEHFGALSTIAEARQGRTFGLREHLATLFRHKRKIIAVFLSTVIGAVAGSYLASNVYVANLRILVQIDREPMRLGSIMTPSPATFAVRPREQVLTEVEIFRSPLIAQKLTEDLGPEIVKQNMRWRWNWVRELPERARDWEVDVRGADRLAERLAAEKENALLYKRLAVLIEDVPLKEELEDLEWRGAHRERFEQLCDELGADQQTRHWRPNRSGCC